MCGFVFYRGPHFEEEKVLKILQHRGPDATGRYHKEHTHLLHTTLALNDAIAPSKQPLCTEDESLVLLFNGEIYNHKALRQHVFRPWQSESDAETLLYLWQAFGPEILNELEGMFAFVLWNQKQDKVYLCRDRHGAKPLYYKIEGENHFAAGSLSQVLLEAKPNLNKHALLHHYLYGFNPQPGSPYNDILEVPFNGRQATCLSWSPGQTEVKHVHLAPPTKEKRAIKTSSELYYELRKSLQSTTQGIRKKGLLLSGGLDSSILAEAFAEKKGFWDEVYTLGPPTSFAAPGIEADLKAVKQLSEQWGLPLKVVPFPELSEQLLSKAIHQLGQPLSDSASLAMMALCAQAQQDEVPILFTGMGADELFAGYRRHRLFQFLYEEHKQTLSSWKKRLLLSLSYSPLLHKRQSQKLRYYLKEMDAGHYHALFAKTPIPDSLEYLLQKHKVAYWKMDRPRDINELLQQERQTYLTQNNLLQADRIGMAHGIELRSPFLQVIDRNVDFHQLPLLKGGKLKYALKKAYRGRLPKTILKRKKTGFAPVLEEALKANEGQLLHSVLSTERLKHTVYFDADKVSSLMEDFLSGNANGKGELLYSILNIQLFLEMEA